MTELTNAEIDAALHGGRFAQASEPRAAAARYDPGSERVAI